MSVHREIVWEDVSTQRNYLGGCPYTEKLSVRMCVHREIIWEDVCKLRNYLGGHLGG